MKNLELLAIAAAVALLSGACAGRGQGSGAIEPAGQETARSAGAEATRPADVPEPIQALGSTLSITLTVRPRPEGEEDPGPGLRSITLHVEELRLEPEGTWPDGTPVSASGQVQQSTAERLVRSLAEAGFFARASRRHSERSPSPTTAPPEGSAEGLPERPPEPHLSVTVTVNDDDWYRYWIGTFAWGDEARAELSRLEAAGDERARQLIGDLGRALGPSD